VACLGVSSLIPEGYKRNSLPEYSILSILRSCGGGVFYGRLVD